MNIDVRMLEADELSRWRKKFTTAWERSKIVCRHVKAIVNPRVMVINIRNCLLNSRLNLSPILKTLFNFLLIFVKKLKEVY